MELTQILSSLYRSRMLVAGATVLALVAAFVVAARGETVRGGTASAEVLVDARDSTLGDLRFETLPLVARSSILARFLGAGGATETIAEKTQIPADEITMIGPPLSIAGVPDQAAAESATQRAENAENLVQVQQGDDLPLLTIIARAPSEEAARNLADGTTEALTDFIGSYQDDAAIPPERRVTIRPLGTTQVNEFVERPSVMLPLLAFAFVLGFSCVGILAWSRIRSNKVVPPSPPGALTVNGNGNGNEPKHPSTARKAKPKNGIVNGRPEPNPSERRGSKATSNRKR